MSLDDDSEVAAAAPAAALIEKNFQMKITEFSQNINKAFDDQEALWKLLAEKEHICNNLLTDMILVSERFSDFHDIWRTTDFSNDHEGFLFYLQIDSEVMRLSSCMDPLEARAHEISRILVRLNLELADKFRELDEVFEKCETATTIEELDLLAIPDITGIENTPYPDPTELTDEWNQAHFLSKVNRCIEALQSLVAL